MSLHVHGSQSLHTLLQKLLNTCKNAPFTNEVIVTQEHAMSTWVSLQIAQQNGLFFQLKTCFLHGLLQDLYLLIQPTKRLLDPYEYNPHVLTWKIMHLLSNPKYKQHRSFRPLWNYLQQPHSIDQLSLCYRLAHVYDKYLLLRHTTLLKWEQTPHPHKHGCGWQAILWKAIVNESKFPHIAAIRDVLIQTLETQSIPNLPQHIHVFGMSHLPSFHLDLFEQLAKHTAVTFYIYTPFGEGDKQHPLLSQYAKRGMQLWKQVTSKAHHFLQDPPYSQLNQQTKPNVFQHLKHCLLETKNVSTHLTKPKDAFLKKEDTSIQVHICTSPSREVEVMYHRLLWLVHEMHYKPSEILVAAPEINIYIPMIEALLDNPETDFMRLPYNVAQKRKQAPHQTIISDFLALLDLIKGRVEVSEVFSFVSRQRMMQELQLSHYELTYLKDLFKKANTTWGADEQREIGLPPFKEGSWQWSIHRIVAGYGMLPVENKLYRQTSVMHHPLENDQQEAFGRFAFFMQEVRKQKKIFETNASLNEWSNRLEELLKTSLLASKKQFLSAEENALIHSLHHLKEIQCLSRFETDISFELIDLFLRQILSQSSGSRNFYRGGITFGNMTATKELPYKVIYLMGLNGDVPDCPSFPAKETFLSFDLLKQKQADEVSKKQEDTYLFLEHMMSCQEMFFMSYTGIDLQHNKPYLPSIVVSDLQEVIKSLFSLEQQGDVVEQLQYLHPAYNFEKEYFYKVSTPSQKRLWTYSRNDATIASNLYLKKKNTPIKQQKSSIHSTDATTKEVPLTIELNQLIAFLKNPPRFTYKNQLQVAFPTPNLEDSDHEPFELNGLQKYLLAQKMNTKTESFDEIYRYAQTRAELPLGEIGRQQYKNLYKEVVKHQIFVSPLESANPATIQQSLSLATHHLSGSLCIHNEKQLLFSHFATFKPKYLIEPWVSLLFFGALITEGVYVVPSTAANSSTTINEIEALLINKETVHRLRLNPKDSLAILHSLIQLYQQAHHECLPFFPSASYHYLKTFLDAQFPTKKDKVPLTEKEAHQKAIKTAANKYEGRDNVHAKQIKDPYISFAYRDVDPFTFPVDKTFCSLSKTVFSPLLQKQEDGSSRLITMNDKQLKKLIS